MADPRAVRPPAVHRWARIALLIAAVLTVVTGCSDATPEPAPTASVTRAPPSTSAAPLAPDAIALRQLGFRYGPDLFPVPRAAAYVSTVDQPNGVTLVLSAPAPTEVAAFLRRSLPAAGFVVEPRTADGLTLTFEGDGWTGRSTATGNVSAILLRPA